VVEVADWPYDCKARDDHPDDTVYRCATHACWWHTERPVMVFETTGDMDSLGRQPYTVRWWADNVGPHLDEQGWREQCQHGYVVDMAAAARADGFRPVIVGEHRWLLEATHA
jgi:hypothetical protein